MSQRDVERHGAQALLATYVQMARYAQLAHSLQQSRTRSLRRRLDLAVEQDEVFRLQQQLDAQQGQGVVLEGAVERFTAQTEELMQFAEAGVTYEDFQDMGVGDLVNKRDVERALERRASRTQPAPDPGADNHGHGDSAAPSDSDQKD